MRGLLRKLPPVVLCTSAFVIAALCGCGAPPSPQRPGAGAAPSLAKTVKGQVIGPAGQPVTGAQVVVSQGRGSFDYTELKTDGEGRFEITLEAPPYWDTLAWCCVYAEGLAVGGGPLAKGENLIVLRTPSELTGTVVDSLGWPVEDAAVRLASVTPSDVQDSFSVPPSLTECFTARTDEEGRWTIRGVPPIGSARVALDDPRFVSEAKEVGFTAGRNTLPALVARPGASLSGRVVYEDGTPAAGVAVMAQAQDLEATMPGWSEALTAADGSYTLSGLADGVYNVMVEEASGDWVAAALEAVTASALMVVELPDLVLTRGAIVEGTVTDMTTGEPLPGVCIGSYGPHRPMSSAAIIGDYTDGNGRYQLRVAPGRSYIYVAGPPPGYALDEGRTFDIGAGDTVAVDFAIGPERRQRRRGWWPF